VRTRFFLKEQAIARKTQRGMHILVGALRSKGEASEKGSYHKTDDGATRNTPGGGKQIKSWGGRGGRDEWS